MPFAVNPGAGRFLPAASVLIAWSLCVLSAFAGTGSDLDAIRRSREARKRNELSRAFMILREHEIRSPALEMELAWLYRDANDDARSLERFEAAIGMAGKTGAGDSLGRAAAGAALAVVSTDRSRAEKYIALAERSMPVPLGPEDVVLLGLARAALEMEKERRVKGIDILSRAVATAKSVGNALLAVRCFLLMGTAGPAGQRERSLLLALDGLHSVQAWAAWPLEARIRLELAKWERRTGNAEKALERLVQASESLEDGDADRLACSLRREEGYCRMELEHWAGAIRSFVLARNAARRTGDAMALAEMTIPLVECCRKRNIIERSRKYIDEALAALKDRPDDRSVSLSSQLRKVAEGLDR